MTWLRFPRVLALVICVYLLATGVLFAAYSARNADFVAHAATTTGTVVELVPRAAAGSAREPSPTVRTMPTAPTVRYTVGGRTYTYTAAHGRYRQRLRVGDPVPVRYLPSDPGQARIQGEDRVLLPLLAISFLLAALAVVVLLVLTRRLGRQPSRRTGRRRQDSRPGAGAETALDALPDPRPDTRLPTARGGGHPSG
ncbi:DUF3592 domain-containing protein [uncultured Friedmanniella sp.]|uniref:DUF3592 domain-containing protein n=1 Tax=uncultured Friedmanniella sp. TaxID=335381 RepID=UPI0035CA5D23